jgi:hypothetical protein
MSANEIQMRKKGALTTAKIKSVPEHKKYSIQTVTNTLATQLKDSTRFNSKATILS